MCQQSVLIGSAILVQVLDFPARTAIKFLLQDFRRSFAELKIGRGAVRIGFGRLDFSLDDKLEGLAQTFALRIMGDELLECFRRSG